MTIQNRAKIGRTALLAALLLSPLDACSVAHDELHGGPQDGTETGNPPVVDVTRVMLIVENGHPRVTGEKGAVSPGGGEIQVESALTGQIYTTRAAQDGSFAIDLLASPADTYELRAADSSGDLSMASAVYLARGSAAVSAGPAGLTCKQRDDLARAQVSAVAQEVASNYCKQDVECTVQETGTVCSDACSGAPTTLVGAVTIEEARTAIESGICRTFTEDGCSVLALPCVPPQPGIAKCVEGACVLSPKD